jgi:WD40 repeat protein
VYLSLGYARGGRDLIVQQSPFPGAPRSEGPSVLRRFDLRTGAQTSTPLPVGRHPSKNFWRTRDGRRLFLTNEADDATYLVDTDSLRLLRRWPVGDAAGTVSPDGRLFALGSDGGRVRLLDPASGRIRLLSGRHEGPIDVMRFTPDGRKLLTAGQDGDIIVRDIPSGDIRERLSGHGKGVVSGLAISEDGRTAFSAGEDERAFMWDLAGDRSLVRPFAVKPFVPDDGDALPRGMILSPDGRTLASGAQRRDGRPDRRRDVAPPAHLPGAARLRGGAGVQP